MKHFVAIIIKFIMIAAIVIIINSFIYGGMLINSLLISLVLTIVSYIVGDLIIFIKSGDRKDYVRRNTYATFSDAILAFVVIYLVGAFLNDFYNTDLLASAFLSAIVIGIGEWLFHRYLNINVFDNDHTIPKITVKEKLVD